MTMNLNASRETVQAVAEVLKYAAFLDDRIAGSDQGRIAAWSEQIERHGLGREDLIAGLQKYYDGPHDRAIGVGDLITLARGVRRERNEREEADEREARQAQWDNVKAAPEETAGIAAAFVQGPVSNKTQRLIDAEFALQSCHGKKESVAAIREYFAAKAQAQKGGKR